VCFLPHLTDGFGIGVDDSALPSLGQATMLGLAVPRLMNFKPCTLRRGFLGPVDSSQPDIEHDQTQDA